MRLTEQPGVQIAIAHGGQLVLEAAFGHADLGAGEALTPRHRFRVASHSKSFTAAGVMKLREMGRLKLDDTAGQYVDGLHPEIAAATISQLLSHTAGIFPRRDGQLPTGPDSGRRFPDAARIRARPEARAGHRGQHPAEIFQSRLRPGRAGDRGHHRRGL